MAQMKGDLLEVGDGEGSFLGRLEQRIFLNWEVGDSGGLSADQNHRGD